MRTPGYIEQTGNIEELVTEHLTLVRKIAWHVHGRVASVVEIDDLVQVGYIGLVTAAQNYTIREGASFASYAGIRIKGAILDHLREELKPLPLDNEDDAGNKENRRKADATARPFADNVRARRSHGDDRGRNRGMAAVFSGEYPCLNR